MQSAAAGGGGGGGPSQQQQQQHQQQQQAQLAVNQAVQQAMQQRQQQGATSQSITDLAANYMSAIQAASKGASAAGGAPNPMSLLGGMQAAGAAGGAGGLNWDPRLSYPMMTHMNTLNAMSNMPNLLSLQQQYGSGPPLAGRGYGLDAAMMIGAASGGLLGGLDQRKSRHIKSPSQLKILKMFFQTNQRPSKEDIRKLVKDTGLPHQEVTRWFRNERHKEKKQQEAKQEAIQGHIKGSGMMQQQPQQHQQHPAMHMNVHMSHPGMLPHQQQMQQQQQQQQQQQNKQKRKRENGSEGSETGSEGPDDLHSNMYGANPAQRMGAIHSLLASLSDPAEIEAVEKVLESKRVAMGGEPGIPLLPQLGGLQPSAENTWQVLQQVFAPKNGETDAKRHKSGKTVAEVAAAAAAASNGLAGLDPTMINGLTQVFAKHPEYLKEINKNLSSPQ